MLRRLRLGRTMIFDTEADLCAAFIGDLPEGWVAYCETAGWDLILVRGADGFQIGVQAKLKFNAKVIDQVLDSNSWAVDQPAPDCRAVLIPRGETRGHYANICAHLGLTVIQCGRERERYAINRHIFRPSLPAIEDRLHWETERDWHEFGPLKRVPLPEYVPDVKAGDKAPLQLTDWKIKALKICATMERRGFVTREDFKHLRLDHRRWMAPGMAWLVLDGGVFKRGPHMPAFEKQHPKVYEQIKAEAGDWMRKNVDRTGVLF